MTLLFLGEWWVSNPRPLVPQTSALTNWATLTICGEDGLRSRSSGFSVQRNDHICHSSLFIKHKKPKSFELGFLKISSIWVLTNIQYSSSTKFWSIAKPFARFTKMFMCINCSHYFLYIKSLFSLCTNIRTLFRFT